MSNFTSGANAFLNSPNVEKTIGPNPTTVRGQGVQVNVHPTLPLIIYPSGKLVIVKNYLNPSESFIYRGHSQPVNVAKFSPNGFWVASGDISGKVRVWSWDNPEHLTKIEVPVFAASVFDLDWDSESKKIVASGEGSGLLVKCFVWDTGSSAGEMMGHNKRVLSVSYKPTRPFRIMSGGEDMKTVFFAGPPFKLDNSKDKHSNFVNSVRYSPDGTKIVSVGADKKIVIYDGATSEVLNEINNAHDGGIYAVSFSPDSSRFATSSADKTLKVWDVSSATLVQTYSLSSDPQIGDAQVSVNWTKDNYLISTSLNGNINIFELANSTGPSRVIYSHQTAITALAVDQATQKVFTGSIDGVVCSRDISGDYNTLKVTSTDKKSIPGACHGGKLVGLITKGDQVISVGWDDRIRWATVGSNAYHTDSSLNGQPLSIFSHPSTDLVVVITNAEISFYRGTTKVGAKVLTQIPYNPTCGALLEESELALGGNDNKTHIYTLNNYELTEKTAIETRSAVTAVAYHPSGQSIAIGDHGRQIEVYERDTWQAKVKGRWVYHTSKITSLAWSPSGDYLASGSLDENIFIWNYNRPLSKTQFAFSHLGGVNVVEWINNERFVSSGNDNVVVFWKFTP